MKGHLFFLMFSVCLSFSIAAFSTAPVFDTETILIGEHVWMLKNYHPLMFSISPKITGVSYNFSTNIDPIYGTLLTYEEALAACPSGWHLPTMDEWHQLFNLYGGIKTAGGPMKTKEYWKSPNTGADNLSGFSAVPAGGGNDTNRFDGFDWSAHFWSNTLKDGKVLVPSLMHDSASVYVLELSPKMRASVRYVKNKTFEEKTAVDLEIPEGKEIVADGKIDISEWDDAVTIEIAVPGRNNVGISVKSSLENLLVLFRLYNPNVKSVLFPEIVIDSEYDRSEKWLADDWWFHVSGSDCVSNAKPGDYSQCNLSHEDWIAVPNYPTDKPGNVELIELIIPFAKIGLKKGLPFGLAFFVTNTVNLWKGWPLTASEKNPSSWGTAMLQ